MLEELFSFLFNNWLIVAAFFVILLALWYWVFTRVPPPLDLLEELPPSQFLKINDIKIHYHDIGRGQPLVFIHGIGASTYSWRFLYKPLSQKYRVIALDLVGFGKSSKPKKYKYTLDHQTKMIDQFLTQLGVSKYFVVGSSMGGALALWLAKTFPQKVKKVAVFSPAVDPSVVPFKVSSIKNLAKYFKFISSPLFMKSILKKIYHNKKLIHSKSLESYAAPYKKADAIYAFIESTNLLRDKRLPVELNKLKTPLLIIYGEHDKMVPRRSIDLLINTLATPPKVLLDHKSGHHNMEDNPGLTIESLINFF